MLVWMPGSGDRVQGSMMMVSGHHRLGVVELAFSLQLQANPRDGEAWAKLSLGSIVDLA